MATSVVAYVGIDNVENILYLSGILQNLGKKVLIVDHSETNALMYSVPKPKDVNIYEEFISFGKIDFTCKIITEDIAERYDIIFLSYGFTEPEEDVRLSTRIVYVTDLFCYNQERLRDIHHYDDYVQDCETTLLVREVVDLKINPEFLLERMEKQVPKENISFLFLDEQDHFHGVISQYTKEFQLKKLSKRQKTYLRKEIKILCPEVHENEIKKAIHRGKKGVFY